MINAIYEILNYGDFWPTITWGDFKTIMGKILSKNMKRHHLIFGHPMFRQTQKRPNGRLKISQQRWDDTKSYIVDIVFGICRFFWWLCLLKSHNMLILPKIGPLKLKLQDLDQLQWPFHPRCQDGHVEDCFSKDWDIPPFFQMSMESFYGDLIWVNYNIIFH